jgi:hypothetical protein
MRGRGGSGSGGRPPICRDFTGLFILFFSLSFSFSFSFTFHCYLLSIFFDYSLTPFIDL